MIKRILIFITLLYHLVTGAQIPDNYYITTEDNTGFELKPDLHNINKEHQDPIHIASVTRVVMTQLIKQPPGKLITFVYRQNNYQ